MYSTSYQKYQMALFGKNQSNSKLPYQKTPFWWQKKALISQNKAQPLLFLSKTMNTSQQKLLTVDFPITNKLNIQQTTSFM